MLLIDDSRAAAARCGICIESSAAAAAAATGFWASFSTGAKGKRWFGAGLLAQLDRRSRRRSRAKL